MPSPDIADQALAGCGVKSRGECCNSLPTDVVAVVQNLSKYKGTDELLQTMHALLLGRPGKVMNVPPVCQSP